ncbi:DNA repair rad9 [Hyphodiscus hymeniophilus]|uniref:DNA repair protein rad9 n=1 Tax=Hyphodiscus hymeniophilus TaxID=353542 RepID=A0A9P6VIG6_9HELO|nr:DNA repair rad9 [Hyphodiscus hymeniophilus]
MAVLNFTLSPEALGKLHDALVCLGKFSEAVSIEAVHDKLILTALNSSKSAYASFTLIGNKFFSKYQYRGVGGQAREKFNCKIYNKALLSVFKGRVVDPTREKDTAVERCDVSIEDGEGETKSRFIIKIVCRHGVLKTYRLTFESVAPMHALFVKDAALNRWSIASKTLREFVEHFGPGAEQLDIYSEDGRVSLTSYTEKVMSGNQVLKQPLHTTVAIDTLEFGEFSVEEMLHIVISVKDFKSIITHAGIFSTTVTALYSHPSSPMQITYSDEGLFCEFILMTIGDSRAASATPAPGAARAVSNRPPSRPALEATSSSRRSATSNMPPPPVSTAASISSEAAKSKSSRPPPPAPQPSLPPSQAMFVPDDDQRWEPVNYEDEEDEMLMWGEPEDNQPMTINSVQRLQREAAQSQIINDHATRATAGPGDTPTQIIDPTQRREEVRPSRYHQ